MTTPDENSNNRSTFYNICYEDCESKKNWKWWSHRKHIVNLNESFLQIIWDYPWTQDGTLLVSHLLDLYFHGKSFLCNSAPIFLKEAEAAGGVPTNVISVAAFLASSMDTFFCFWTPLNFDFFLWQFFFSADCFRPIFPPFGIALCERFTWSPYEAYEERNNTVLCRQALQVWKHWTGMVLEGTKEQTNHRTSYQCKKPLQNAFVWNGYHGNGKTTLYTIRKI